MITQHVETLIVGAGQAGLATGYHLTQMGRECLVLEANERIGDNWRSHYDSLTLYTPAKYDGLPGLPFPADPWHFPDKDEVAAYLEQYAAEHDLPVRTGVRVDRVAAAGDGFEVTVGDGTITCDNVVVATGTFGRTPYVPEAAEHLDPGIRQLHSSEYHGPADLQPGRVLVVGAAHSGCDLALEVSADHPTTLVGRDCGQVPFRLESPRAHVLLPLAMTAFKHVLTRRTPIGRKKMGEVRFHGGPGLRVREPDLAARGVERNEARVVGAREGRPLLADGSTVDAANVIWCTGFRQRLDWIDLPVLGEDGWPVEERGVAAVPGLFFCGLSFQYAFSSMLLPGVGRDARYVARRIAARERDRVPAA